MARSVPEPRTAQEAYRVEPADLDTDAHDIIALWSSNLGHAERRQGKFAWFYRGNPAGRPTVLLLRHAQSDAPVGTVGIGFRAMRCGAASFSAGLMGDFAVNAQHRTLFPALTLQRAVLARGLASHPVLYGFPNAKSLPVVQRAGFAVMGHLGRYVCVLRTSDHLPSALPRALRRLVGGALDTILHTVRLIGPSLLDREKHDTRWLSQPDDRFDALWAEQVADRTVIGTRDRAFLHWRFVQKPSRHYRLFALTARVSPERPDALRGYAVCEPVGETLYVRDFLAAPPWQRNLSRLFHALMREAARQGYARISMECLGPDAVMGALSKAGLRLRDACSQPVILATTQEGAACLAGKDWYLTSADADE